MKVMQFTYAYKTYYYIMDTTHQFVVDNASYVYHSKNRSLDIRLKSIEKAQGISVAYSPRWNAQLKIKPVCDTLNDIRTAIANNTATIYIDDKKTLENITDFEILTVSEEITGIVESQESIKETLREEEEEDFLKKKTEFESLIKKINFDKLSTNDIRKLQEVLDGKR